MQSFDSTYRFIATLSLWLFISTLVFPLGIAAANFNCDMKMPQVVDVCCVTSNSKQEKQDTQNCEQQTFCAQSISSSRSDIPAITQNSNIVIAVELSEQWIIFEQGSDHPPAVKDEPASLHNHPPAFLLNSTFLN